MRPPQISLGAIPVWLHRPPAAAPDRPRPSIRSIGRRLLVRATVAGAISLLLIAAVLALFRGVYADRIYPAVSVANMDVSGMSRADAQRIIQQRANALEHGTILLSYHGKTWSPALADLGLQVDVDHSLDRAFAVGRAGNGWDRLSGTIGLMRHTANVPLDFTWDRTVFNQWLDGADRDLGLPPHDAYLNIDGVKVSIVPEVSGTVIDRSAAGRLIGNAITALHPISTEMPVQPHVAKVHAGDLTGAQQQIATALAKPVPLTYAGQHWTLQPADLGQFIQTDVDPAKAGAAAVTIGVDQEKLAAWLNGQLAGKINKNPVNAKVAWNDDEQRPVAAEPSQNGARLAPMTLATGVSQSLLGNHQAVAVPVTVLKPQIDSNNLAALGITTKLGVGSSDFEGSDQGRATNIAVGARLLNGTLIPPHGTFSFNHAIGGITADKGYVISQVIDGQNIGTDIGGGICQVSTTVYRAAFESGMPIVEWWPHTFRLGFYEQDDWTPGIDASILQIDGDPDNPNSGDFRFENPSAHWMLVESYVDGPRVFVILYGADLGYKVDIVGPADGPVTPHPAPRVQVDQSLGANSVEQVQGALDGYEFTYTRTVRDAHGNIVEGPRDFTTDFSSRPAIYKVSPDMSNWKPSGDSD